MKGSEKADMYGLKQASRGESGGNRELNGGTGQAIRPKDVAPGKGMEGGGEKRREE